MQKEATLLLDLLTKFKEDPESVLEYLGIDAEDATIDADTLREMYTGGSPDQWYHGLHLCPGCGNHTLEIGRSFTMFD